MGSGGKGAAGQVASAGVYVGGRTATNALTVGQAFVTAAAQIAAMKWMVDRQQSMWDHVSSKQINCVEVALNEFNSSVNNLLTTFKDVYPEVPVVARFQEVSPQAVQFASMVENIANAPKTAEYMNAANHWHRLNYQARVELLSPGFTNLLTEHIRQVSALMRGELPVDEAVSVVSDVAENAAMLGRIGNTFKVTHAAMGVRRLQLQHLGREEMGRRLLWMEQMSPAGKEVNINELMVSPERRLLFALEQAQLLQNDLQNLNNASAQKPPHRMAELQTRLQMAVSALSFNANKANMQNQFVPNFPALFAPTVSKLATDVNSAMSWEKNPDSGQDLGGHLTPAAPGTAV